MKFQFHVSRLNSSVNFLGLPIAFLKSQLKAMLKMQVPGPAADLLAQRFPEPVGLNYLFGHHGLLEKGDLMDRASFLG